MLSNFRKILINNKNVCSNFEVGKLLPPSSLVFRQSEKEMGGRDTPVPIPIPVPASVIVTVPATLIATVPVAHSVALPFLVLILFLFLSN